MANHKIPQDKEAYIIRHFPTMLNPELKERTGVCITTIVRIARREGLKKNAYVLHEFRSKVAKRVRADSETFAGTIFKPGHRFTGEIEKRRIRNISSSLKRTLDKERARISYGMPQKTKRKLGHNRPKAAYRAKMRTCGYIIARGDNVAYYNESTRRRDFMEKRAREVYGIETTVSRSGWTTKTSQNIKKN